MSRSLTENERQIVLRLVGEGFKDAAVLRAQLDGCTVNELADGVILEFNVISPERFSVRPVTLAEGSFDDADGVPVILTLLQRDGRLWRLDISKADSSRITIEINPESLRTFGHGGGLKLG